MKNTLKLARIVLIFGLILSACKRQAEAPASVAALSPTLTTPAVIGPAKADQVLVDRTAPENVELVIEIAELAGKGYPGPVDLDSGAGTQVVAISTPLPNTP